MRHHQARWWRCLKVAEGGKRKVYRWPFGAPRGPALASSSLTPGACRSVQGGGINGKPVSGAFSHMPCDSGAAPATVSEERTARQPIGRCGFCRCPHGHWWARQRPGKARFAPECVHSTFGTREPGYRPDAMRAGVAEGNAGRRLSQVVPRPDLPLHLPDLPPTMPAHSFHVRAGRVAGGHLSQSPVFLSRARASLFAARCHFSRRATAVSTVLACCGLLLTGPAQAQAQAQQ